MTSTNDTLSIRVGVTGDAEAQAKLTALGDSANQSFVKAGTSADQASSKIESALKRWTAAIDPAARAQQKLAAGTEVFNQALAQGLITQQEHASALDLLNQKYAQNTNSSNAFAGALGKVNSVLGLFGISLGVAAAVSWTKSVIASVGGLVDLSQQLGVTVESLQVYRYAAVQTGASEDQLETGLARLTKTIGEAADGNDQALASFNKLGVGVLDSSDHIRTTDSVLGDVAKSIAAISDPAARATLEFDLFGRAGKYLGPLLVEIAGGMDKLTAAAKADSVVVSNELAQSFKEASDQLKIFGMQATVATANVVDFLEKTAAARMAATQKTVDAYRAHIAGSVTGTWSGPLPPREPSPSDVGGSGPGGSDSGNHNPQSQAEIARSAALTKYISDLHAAAEASGLDTEQKKLQTALLEAQNKLVDAQGKKDRDLTASQRQSITQSVYRQSAGDEISKSTETVAAASRAADAQKAVAVAARKSASAEHEVELQNKITAASYQLISTAKKSGNADQIAAAQALADKNAAAMRESDRADQETKSANIDRGLEQSTQEKQLEISLQTLSAPLRAQELADLKTKNELLQENYVIGTADYDAEFAKRTALNEAYAKADTTLKQIAEDQANQKQIAGDFTKVISTSFEDATLKGKNLRSVFQGLDQDIAQIIERILITKPLDNALTALFSGKPMSASSGANPFAGFSGLVSSISPSLGNLLFGPSNTTPAYDPFQDDFPSANGNVFDRGHVLSRFAVGGIVTAPTYFPTASGTGVMGESGPEAVMPLTRMSNGKLGVAGGSGGGDTHHYYIDARGSGPGVEDKIANVVRMVQGVNSSIESRAVAASFAAARRDNRFFKS